MLKMSLREFRKCASQLRLEETVGVQIHHVSIVPTKLCVIRFVNGPRYVRQYMEYRKQKYVGGRKSHVSVEQTAVVDPLKELRNHTSLQTPSVDDLKNFTRR